MFKTQARKLPQKATHEKNYLKHERADKKCSKKKDKISPKRKRHTKQKEN